MPNLGAQVPGEEMVDMELLSGSSHVVKTEVCAEAPDLELPHMV